MLIDLKGFLAIVSFSSATHIETWVLRDYENKEWVKEYRSSTQVWARETDEKDRSYKTLYMFFSIWEDKRFLLGFSIAGCRMKLMLISSYLFLILKQTASGTCNVLSQKAINFTRAYSVIQATFFLSDTLAIQLQRFQIKYYFLKMAPRIYVTPHNTTNCNSSHCA